MPRAYRDFPHGQLEMWLRDNPAEFLVFPFPPEKIRDSRRGEFTGVGRKHSDDDEDPIQGHKKPTFIVENPRRISFTAIFDERAMMKPMGPLGRGQTPQDACTWLRQQQAPVLDARSAVDDPSVTGQPPVLILSGYDVFECMILDVDIDVLKINPYTQRIMAAEVSVSLVQYVDEENKFQLWKGLGGAFSSRQSLKDGLEGRREKRRVSEAFESRVRGVDTVSNVLARIPFGGQAAAQHLVNQVNNDRAAIANTPGETFVTDYTRKSIFL
jgi:hypothetical protein